MYYNINERNREAELGIMIGDRSYWDKGYGSDTVTILVGHIFKTTKLERVYLKTLSSNIRAQTCFEKCGFSPLKGANRGGHRFLVMELYRSHFEGNTER